MVSGKEMPGFVFRRSQDDGFDILAENGHFLF